MPTNVFEWSGTASDNATSDSSINWAENQLPGTVNGSARAMMAAVKRMLADLNGSVSSGGSSNAYTVTPNTGHTSLANGLIISFKASFTNTGASTLNFNSLGAKKILTADGECAPGQLTSGARYILSYDTALDSSSGAWFLENPSEAVGKLIPYAGGTAPAGHVFPYGQAVSRTTYPALWAALGTYHGTGDGSTTFNLPDLRGRGVFGRDDMGGSAASRITSGGSGIGGTSLGAVGGAQTHTLTTAESPAHTHTFSTTSDAVGDHSHTGTSDSGGNHQHTYSGTTSGQSNTHSHALTTNRLFENAAAGGAFGALSTNAGSANIGTSDTASADHTHTYSGTTVLAGTHAHTFTTNAAGAHAHTLSGTTNSTGGGGAHNNMPPAIICNFVMRLA